MNTSPITKFSLTSTLYPFTKIKIIISFPFCYFFIDAKKICFLKYGCFSTSTYYQVSHAALPSHPDVIQTKFFLHTRRNPKIAEELNLNNISSITTSNFDPSRRTILIVHGFSHDSQKPWVVKMKNELLRRYWYNVISVDWRKGASYLTLSYLKVSV